MSKVGVADSSSSPSHLGSGGSSSGQTRAEPNKRPLIVAAYRYSEPFRKRRVKVPTNIRWKEFLALIYSRLEIDTNLNIEIYDEQGIEIVDVDDLVENDVLVVRDMPASMKSYPKSAAKGGKPVAPVGGGGVGGREGGHGGEMIQRYPEQANSVSVSAVAVRSHDKSRDLGVEHSMMVSTPQLSHFIQLNSFGYYFLAEVENMKLVPTHGKIKKIHCIVKVPHCQKGAPRTFADEADLLRKVSNHKSIISPPSVQILNFSDDSLQHFFSSLLQQKQVLVRELFMSGGCMEAYIYPLYGVTMATRVKNGLTPDKVLKYSYQLADIMFYLQQRGVIHQNLLPENIQVMSNDRVVLCNFETAVQTNPTSCLLIAPQSVIAPGNRKGLAPEVVRSFSCLRVEGECIDYSTQYPWSFGVLSVLMATGLHPLKDYPESYEGGNKVKYRSHDYQALPDAEQYPPIFCKLVKRSLACDPIRRPTLPQILSIIKKDSKVIALMTGKRLGGPSSSTVAQQQRGVSTGGSGQERGLWGSMESINRHAQGGVELFESSKTSKSSKPNLPSSFLSKDFYDTHPPFANSHTSRHLPNIDDTASDVTGYRRSSNLQHQQRMTRTEAHHSSHFEMTGTERMVTSDPIIPATGHRSAPTRRKQRSPWDTFGGGGEEEKQQLQQQRQQQGSGFSFVSLAQPDHSPPMAVKHREGLTLRRYSSSGAFSDDFVIGPQLSRASSSRSVHVSQAMRRVGSASRPHGSSERLLGRSGTTSESDLSQIQEFQYHRLGLSPDERFHRSDQERLLHASSPEMDTHDLTSGMHEYSQKTRRGRAHAQPSFSPETSPRLKVARSNSYQRSVVDAKLKVPSPLSMRRCLSNDKSMGGVQEGGREPRSERMELEPPTRDETNPPVYTLSSPQRQQAPGERTEEGGHHQRTNSNSLSTGPDGILMSSSTVGNTETQTTTLSLDLTSQSQLLHGGEVSGSEFIERMDTQSGRESSEERAGILSPVNTSTTPRSDAAPATNSTAFWTSATPAVSTSGTRTVQNGENRPGHYHFSTEDSSASNGQRLPGVQIPPHGGDGHQDQDVVMISPVTCTPHSQAGLDIFPQAFSSMDSNPVRGDSGGRNHNDASVCGSQVPLLGAGEDEELTPREEDNTREQQLRQHDSELEENHNMSSWMRGRISTSETAAASSSLSSPVFTAEDLTIDSESLYASPNHLPPHRDYGMMSPIPEASQELTNSMSMSQSNANRLSGSHMRSQSRIRSVSPISEHANVSGIDDTTPSPRHGSVSPFRHSAVTSSYQDSTQRSQSVSEHVSTTLSSVLNRPQPQLMDTGTAAAIVMNSESKDQGQDRDSISSYQHHQSRSKSATPIIPSGAASREGSVSSTRGEAVHSDRPDVQSETNTAEQLSGTTSSGSREASVSSSTRAQVTIDVSSAVRALTSQPTTQSPSSSSSLQLRGFHSRVTNYSREPLLQSSSESIEHGGGQVRSSTPQSSSSAPARIHSTDPGQRPPDVAARQVSPLTTTAHAQRAIHPQQQQQLQPQHQQQLQQPQPAANTPHTSKRYSQQRVAELSSSKSQQRINQDIEMMHLAISGMDATNRSISRTRSSAVPRSQSVTQTAERQGATTTSRSTASSTAGRVPPHGTAAPNMDSSRTFRPITPAMMDTSRSRPSSAPGTTTATVRPAASSSTSTPIPNSTHTGQHQQQFQQQSPPPSVPSNITVSQSATHSQNFALQPPRVSTDSYDYLPPYSPPQNGGRPQSQQQQQQQQQLQLQQEAAAQQSSQQRPRSRQLSEPPLYPEPPPSYDEIFGGQSSSGRQRRRRGQRRQRGAETLPGANEDGNRRSRSELRRSSSQNEGPIRPSSSQRRLASLTNFFRRAKRQIHSGNSQNQSSRAVQNNINAPTSVNTSAADACPPMDTNEYVASWVESYSRTPRPVEAMEARAEAMSLSVGSTATHSLAYSHVSRAASDVTDSQPHSASYHGGSRGGGGGGGSGGSHPVPYRPPPPFPTENADSTVSSYPPAAVRGFSQVSTDYSLSLSRASSDVGQSRISRNNRSQPSSSSSSSRPTTNYVIGPGYQQHHTRPSVGNVSRRGMMREHRRPVSAIITSEVSTNNNIVDGGVMPAHSGTDLVRFDSNSHRTSPQQQQQQRQLSRHLDNTAHISTSCFDIASPVPADSEHQHSQHTCEVNAPSSTSRQGTEAASSAEQCARSNDSVRTTSRQSQSLSLSQGNSQGGDSTLAANVNANNINTTAASPRASNASSSSPINVVLVIGSNTSLGQNSQPNPPSPNSNIINLSPTAQEDPAPLAISPTSWSNSERRASAGTSSLSSRAAARQRVEMRLSQRDVSSSDEESSQRSDRSQNGVVRSHRLRNRRRRSQGSIMSQAESLRSNSRVDVQQLSQTSRPADLRVSSNSRVDVQQLSQTSRPADLREEEMETNVESRALSQDQSHVVDQTDVRPNGTVEEEQEVQTVEVAIEDASEGSTQNHQSLVSSGKSCGHSCEAESQALCCICTVEQGAVHATTEGDIIRMLSNCSLCQRRCNNQIHQTHSYSNKIHSHSQASSRTSSQMATAPATTTTGAAGEVAQQRQRGGKNCAIM